MKRAKNQVASNYSLETGGSLKGVGIDVTPFKSPGILPLTKSSFGVSDFGWSLPGHGFSYPGCGKTLVFGCLNVEGHNQSNLDRDVVGKVFVDLRKSSCLRAECPVCYEKWAGKEAHKIEYRLEQWRGKGKPIHLVVSVPRSLWYLPLVELRSKSQVIAKRVNFWGGCCIVHHKREMCKICGSHKDPLTKRCEKCGCSEFLWYFSPHFHMIGYGWIHGHKVVEVFEKTGWVCRNVGVRDSVMATALYQLSHCGVHKNRHSVVWFGSMSYNKLRVKPEVVEKKVCPLCKSDLVRLRWVGEGDPPLPGEEGEYFLDPKGWVEKKVKLRRS